jgi:Predicted membrane protein
MSSVAPPGAEEERVSTGDSIRDWVASFLRYAELRLRLLGLESKDAGLHLLILAILFASTVVLFAGFLLMFAVFLLYLIITLLHWEWGWGALLCAGVLLLGSITAAILLRFRIVRPVFALTLAELQKDREWLKTKTRNVE